MIRFVIKDFSVADIVLRLYDKKCDLDAEKTDEKGIMDLVGRDELYNDICKYVKPLCIALDLGHSLRQIEQIRVNLQGSHKPPVPYREAAVMLDSLRRTVNAEMEDNHFAFIPHDKSEFFDKSELFGNVVNTAFPSAVSEIRDAGNCLSADLNTAAVFHLMRTTEHGLRALARHLRVNRIRPRVPLEYEDWGTIINAISRKLDGLPHRRSRRGNESLQFYRRAISDCETLKDVWRNTVMHTRGRYDSSEAAGVFNRVKEFMQNLSKRLAE